VQRVELPTVPPLLCPVCDTPADGTDTACGECGLVFASRVPAALQALPDYQVLRPLGDGGMSSVYLARKRYGDQLCVLKTLATVDSTSDPHWRAEAARCLRQEADMLRQLDHPNIARMLSWYSGKQADLLVLEYVPGLTLEQRLTRSDGRGGTLPGAALSPAEALAYGVSMAGVLEYLEQQEPPVVHHDIKPANLIVRPDDGRLMLVDFGSALLLPDASSNTVKLDSYGTPGYAAPEQYQGHSSPASDVYSLGATLYHLLTDDDPTAHPLAFPALANLPPQIADVLRPALAREPQQRPTAYQLRAALEQALSTV
jgi:serine/threonine protein kinase